MNPQNAALGRLSRTLASVPHVGKPFADVGSWRSFTTTTATAPACCTLAAWVAMSHTRDRPTTNTLPATVAAAASLSSEQPAPAPAPVGSASATAGASLIGGSGLVPWGSQSIESHLSTRVDPELYGAVAAFRMPLSVPNVRVGPLPDHETRPTSASLSSLCAASGSKVRSSRRTISAVISSVAARSNWHGPGSASGTPIRCASGSPAWQALSRRTRCQAASAADCLWEFVYERKSGWPYASSQARCS